MCLRWRLPACKRWQGRAWSWSLELQLELLEGQAANAASEVQSGQTARAWRGSRCEAIVQREGGRAAGRQGGKAAEACRIGQNPSSLLYSTNCCCCCTPASLVVGPGCSLTPCGESRS